MALQLIFLTPKDTSDYVAYEPYRLIDGLFGPQACSNILPYLKRHGANSGGTLN